MKIAAERPYSVSFAVAMAAASVGKGRRETVGPKDSVA